jgi:Asp-tRNA(Asn)/Glu-tRNA(Gln) amidotransferase B subunit
MFKTGDHPWYVIERLGLWLLPDDEVLRVAYLTVCDNPDLALKYRDGNEKVLNALVGKVMGQIKGRAVGTWVEDCVKASIGYIYQHCP